MIKALALLIASVIQTIDGDTVRMQVEGFPMPIKVRFASVDCPEKDQAYGYDAMLYTQRMLLNPIVKLRTYGLDIHQRLLADVYLENGSKLNESLVADGQCWAYYPRQVIYNTLQENAQRAHKGLWAFPNPIAPWDYRKHAKAPLTRTHAGRKP